MKGWLGVVDCRFACGWLALCLMLGLLGTGTATAQQNERRWLKISEEMYPQPDDPGTQAQANIPAYLDGLKGQLSALEVEAFQSAMAEEMHNFQINCRNAPTYLIDHPAGISDWGEVLLRNLTFPVRSVRYWIQTCKASFPMTVFLTRAPSGEILAGRGHPGFTLSNLALQVDSEATMHLTVAQMRPESCKQEPMVFFTRVLAYAKSPYDASNLDFLEEWTALACGKLYKMEVELTHSPRGGVDFSFLPIPG